MSDDDLGLDLDDFGADDLGGGDDMGGLDDFGADDLGGDAGGGDAGGFDATGGEDPDDLLASVTGGGPKKSSGSSSAPMVSSGGGGGIAADQAVFDIPVTISAVLGKASMQVSQLLKLGRGAVVELDRKVGEPIDIYVNSRLVARGEVVVEDDRLGVTLTEIVRREG